MAEVSGSLVDAFTFKSNRIGRDNMNRVSRRDFLQTIARGSVATWTFSQLGLDAFAQTERPPNLLIMVADDMGWGDVGYHGSEFPTPNIDRLVAEGVELDRFYAFPVCSPTRVALMTGRSPNRMGIGSAVGKNEPGPPIDEHFLPQSLRAAGYQSWAFGKWHLGQYGDFLPNKRGFDHFYGARMSVPNYYKHNSWRYGNLDWFRNEEAIEEEGYATHLFTDEAIRVLKGRDRDRPFFLYLPYTAPHIPLEAPEEAVAKYAHIKDEKRRVYAAMVDVLDASIGRVLDALDDEGLRDNTLVMFFSDNGGQETRGGADNGPLRGQKGTVFEGGTRTPAVMRWPGVLPAGKKVQQMIGAVDLFPTLTTALGVAPKNEKPFDGQDLWGQIRGEASEILPQRFVIARSKTEGAVWHGAWKLVKLPEGTLLFRIREDPNEERDLSAKYPDVVKELTGYLNEMTQTLPESRGRAPTPVTPGNG